MHVENTTSFAIILFVATRKGAKPLGNFMLGASYFCSDEVGISTETRVDVTLIHPAKAVF